MREKSVYYSPQIDGLRFVAALLVFIHHSPDVPFLSGIKEYGWIGVDLFLAISAFLLTKILLLEWKATEAISIRRFYIRRALRIFPLYIFYLTAVCAWALIEGHLVASTVVGWWLGFMSFTGNLMTAIGGYSPVPFTAHLWTISLEEQVYAVLPMLLLLYLLSGAGRRSFVAIALSLIAVLIVARLGFTLLGTQHPFIWVLPLRADSFVLGAIAAVLMTGAQMKHSSLLTVIGIALMASVVLFPPVDVPGLYQVIGYTVIALGCVLVVVGVQTDGLLARVLSWSPVRYFGKISYGVYVYHVLCISMAGKLVASLSSNDGPGEGILIFALGLAMTLALSSLSYELFEKSFLKIKNRYSTVISRPV
ncbi:acyltransferase [Ruegeria sp. A3M17]|uniref:acyltransferase family protein n=1 Tax=Ruegeria sp. A3M17 TaxID=2267229 RepID=UPI0013149B74|nr:acyltransferase [Ruegeria sp. A3M17]